jgi:hypothetical protein
MKPEAIAKGPRFIKALVEVFGQEKVDAFPELLMGAMKALFDQGHRLGIADEKELAEVNGEADRDVAWKDAYDVGWNDYAIESLPEVERRIAKAHEDGYREAVKYQAAFEKSKKETA